MSGSAALAAARKRRVNTPQPPTSLNNTPQQNLNKMVNDLEPVSNTPTKMSLGQMVVMHDKRIIFLKNEIDAIKQNNNLLNDSDKKNSKVTFSDVQDNKSLDELKNKISTIETHKEDSNKKILELENELSKSKKDIENFKIIFLNVNKVINDLKTQLDTNNNEINNMRTFLDNHTFISNEDANIIENTTDDNTEIENNDPIRMVVEENIE